MTSARRENPQPPGAIRTFLIADIRGYTRFTAELGDEAASRLAAKFAQVVAEGVEAWGGTLVELRGDEALVMFDSPRRALRAAVELQGAFADETRAERNLPLTVGIGLDAGEAVPVGEGYRGAALNLAARLCATAAAGEIRATQTLVHLAGRIDGLDYARLEAAHFKGIDQEVAPILVTPHDGSAAVANPMLLAPVSDRPPLPPELEAIVPLAGRVADLHWLGWHWRRARHGHGRAVSISGPTGIGKTRLAAELAATAHRDRGAVVYLSGARAGPEDVRRLAGADGPMLIVADDLEAATPALLEVVSDVGFATAGRPILVVVTHQAPASAEVSAAVDHLTAPEGRRALSSLDPEAVRSIAALYAERSIDELPLQMILEESEGIPSAVHRVASQWARSTVTRRLGASAERAAAGRRGLRAAEEALIDDVADLELARERTRLYVTDVTVDDATEPAVVVCPYKGLAAFEATDAQYFFGRDRVVAELIARLVGSPFVGLVGASGSGKSSVLRAGLLPAVAGGVLPSSERWIQVVMRPGEHPLAELGRALRAALPEHSVPADGAALDAALGSLASGVRLALVVDQFEELFTATRDEGERARFVELLTTQRSALKVIVALRADHYGHCAAYVALARLLGSDQVLVGPLDTAELAAVIEHPAQAVGLRVEPELTEALVVDAGREPGALPLLSTALLELWQARHAGRLTLAAYRARGGLRGAVARLAESAFGELTPDHQAIARSMLLRLAGPGEGEGLVRRRVSRRELDADRDPAVAEVVDTLTMQRLLTSGEGYVEVAHEALLREWPRLRGWLEEDAAGRRLRLHLIGAARDWEERGREADDLYRGARLAATLEWASEHDVDLNATERAFVEESRAAAEFEGERQRRTNRRLRGLLAGAALFLVAAIGAGGFAAIQLNRAEEEAAHAEQEAGAARDAEELARSRELAASAISVLDDDPSLSKLLALAASSIADPPLQSVSALHQALAADPIVARYTWPAEWDILELWTDLDPTGRYLVASGASEPSRYIEVFDLTAGNVLWSYDVAPSIVINAPVFARDGQVVVAGVTWVPAENGIDRDAARRFLGAFIWDARSGELLERFDLGACGGWVQGISETHLLVRTLPTEPEGCFQAIADVEVTVELLDLRTGEREVLAARPGWTGAALSGDGGYVAFEDAGDVVVLDRSSGVRTPLFKATETEQGDQFVRALNHDGSLLLYGGRPIEVWDVALGEVVASYDGHAGESWFADFGPSGLTVYSTGRDGSLRHWSAETGEELAALPSVGNATASALADGRVLVANSETRTAAVVDAGVRGEVDAIATCTGFVASGSLAVAGPLAAFEAVCGDDPTPSTVAVDLEQGVLRYELAGHEGQTLSISPDGRRFVRQEATGTVLGPLMVRDLLTGAEIVELEGLCDWDWQLLETLVRVETGECEPFPNTPFAIQLWQVRWSPDGSMIAAVDHGGFDGYVAVWDAESGELMHTQPRDDDLGFGPNDLIFTPDSQGLILAHGGKGARQRLSTETWEVVAEVTSDQSLEGGGWLGFIGVAPDGTLVGVGGFAGIGAGALHWFDIETLEAQRDRSKPQIHDAAIKAVAMSPDGSLMATGAADGFVRVWDARTGILEHEIPFGRTQVQGVAFIDDSHLAVTPEEGNLYVVTIDTDELLEIVRESLTRGFTTTECSRFSFGDECPSLAELRGD